MVISKLSIVDNTKFNIFSKGYDTLPTLQLTKNLIIYREKDYTNYCM